MPKPISNSQRYFCQLSSLGAIQLTGEQADTYLQGQVSVNMELLGTEHALLACHCDFKGKMWNCNYLIRHDEKIDYLVTASALPSCLAELKKYGVFSKVEIVDISESKTFIGFGGSNVKPQLIAIFPDISDEHLSVASNELGWVLSINTGSEIRYLCAFENTANILQTMTDGMDEEPEAFWSALDINDGIAPIFAATSNEYVPQMFNMQMLNAIDFNKGCYMGQEVVARTKYLGKNKRATYLLTTSLNTSNAIKDVSAGDLLEKSVGENWRRGGTIVNASQYQDVLYVLAVLSNDAQTGDVLRLKDSPDVTLVIGDLPYSLDEEVDNK